MKESIGQRAVNFAGDRSQGGGHGYPSWEANLIEKGYIKGAKDQNKLIKKIIKEKIQYHSGGELGKSLNEIVRDQHIVKILTNILSNIDNIQK